MPPTSNTLSNPGDSSGIWGAQEGRGYGAALIALCFGDHNTAAVMWPFVTVFVQTFGAIKVSRPMFFLSSLETTEQQGLCSCFDLSFFVLTKLQ